MLLNPVCYYRVARFLYLRRIHLLPRIVSRFCQLLLHCYLPCTAELGEGCDVGYSGIGVLVHARSRLGRCVFLGPGVVIGGRSQQTGVPRIGDNVYIAAGAKVLGDITIGSGSVIGANAVVLHSVPDRTAVAGVPARQIKADVDVFALTGWPPRAESGDH